jgi:small subunit ribosomal protein S1
MDEAGSQPSTADFEALLNAQGDAYQKGFHPGERVKALVLEVGPTHVILDVQAKREGLIPVEEFRDAQGTISVQAGQALDVVFLTMQDGAFLFTTRHYGAVAVQQTLAQAHASGLPVEGLVQAEVKGGYEVTIAGRRAFCPYSQIALFRQEGAQYIGQKLTFIVEEYDAAGRNILVSRRAVLEQEREARREALQRELQPGQTRAGIVTRLADFGFFVDIGGVEGLVPLKEMAWQRGIKPADVVKEGDGVQVVIRDIDWERNRISLSLRATQEDPFNSAAARFPVGSALRGKVTHIEPFGAFVEVLPGVEGLVPIGSLGGGRRINSPRDVLTEGQELDVHVETIDIERRRIGLKPIDTRLATLKPGALDVGMTVEGIVEGIKDFGVFVRLSETQTGLLHISETDVGPGGNAAAKLERAIPPGSKITVVVKQNDGKRISLTLPSRWEHDGGAAGNDAAAYLQKQKSPQSLGSLGDALAGLKL